MTFTIQRTESHGLKSFKLNLEKKYKIMKLNVTVFTLYNVIEELNVLNSFNIISEVRFYETTKHSGR